MCLRWWQFLQNSSAVNVCSGITWLDYAMCIAVCFVCNSTFYCTSADSRTTRNCKIYPENPNIYRTRRLTEEIQKHSWLSPWISGPFRHGITTIRRIKTQKISDLV